MLSYVSRDGENGRRDRFRICSLRGCEFESRSRHRGLANGRPRHSGCRSCRFESYPPSFHDRLVEPVWRNGSRGRFKPDSRKGYEFESRHRHIDARSGVVLAFWQVRRLATPAVSQYGARRKSPDLRSSLTRRITSGPLWALWAGTASLTPFGGFSG